MEEENKNQSKHNLSADQKFFVLTIQTPDSIFFTGDIKSVIIPSILGSFQVLYNHAAIVAAIEYGMVTAVTTNNEMLNFFVEGGIAEVKKNVAKIAVSKAENVRDIEFEKLQKLLEDAKLDLNEVTQSKQSTLLFEKASKKVELLKHKIKFVEKYQH